MSDLDYSTILSDEEIEEYYYKYLHELNESEDENRTEN